MEQTFSQTLFKGTLSRLKYHSLKLWPVACYNSAILSWNRIRKLNSEKKSLELIVKGVIRVLLNFLLF